MVYFPLNIKSYGCKMDVSYTFGSLLANSALPAYSEIKPSLYYASYKFSTKNSKVKNCNLEYDAGFV